MGRLAAEHREILLLIHRDRRTYRQAAEALNLSDETMRSRLAAARQRLRALLEGADRDRAG
jgi:DNA-directed RNA polymerase specialized sigma24 family protein